MGKAQRTGLRTCRWWMIPPGARSFLSVVLTTVSVAFCTRTKRGVSSAAGRARLAARRGPDAGARSSFFFLKLSPQNTKTLMIFFLIEIDKESVNRDSGHRPSPVPCPSLEENQTDVSRRPPTAQVGPLPSVGGK